MYLYRHKLKTLALKKSCRSIIMQKFQRADSRVSSMKNSSVSGWKRETINIQRQKRGVTTSLIFILINWTKAVTGSRFQI